MENLVGDEPQYKVVYVSGKKARVQIYHERAIVFKPTKETGTLTDSNLSIAYKVGNDRDGRITNDIVQKARRHARIAINKERRRLKSQKKKY